MHTAAPPQPSHLALGVRMPACNTWLQNYTQACICAPSTLFAEPQQDLRSHRLGPPAIRAVLPPRCLRCANPCCQCTSHAAAKWCALVVPRPDSPPQLPTQQPRASGQPLLMGEAQCGANRPCPGLHPIHDHRSPSGHLFRSKYVSGSGWLSASYCGSHQLRFCSSLLSRTKCSHLRRVGSSRFTGLTRSSSTTR